MVIEVNYLIHFVELVNSINSTANWFNSSDEVNYFNWFIWWINNSHAINDINELVLIYVFNKQCWFAFCRVATCTNRNVHRVVIVPLLTCHSDIRVRYLRRVSRVTLFSTKKFARRHTGGLSECVEITREISWSPPSAAYSRVSLPRRPNRAGMS